MPIPNPYAASKIVRSDARCADKQVLSLILRQALDELQNAPAHVLPLDAIVNTDKFERFFCTYLLVDVIG